MHNNKVWQEFWQVLTDFQQNQAILSQYQPYNMAKSALTPFLPDGKPHQDWQLIIQACEYYAKHTINTHHAQFANQLWSGQSQASLMGEVLSVMTNTSMATFETAPMATIIENHCLKWLKQLFGFEMGEAQMATGGSHGNMMAMMLARNEYFGDNKKNGLFAKKMGRVLISAESHYSSDKAANILGLGTDCLIKIPVLANGTMDTQEIAKICATSDDIMMIIATAGTTVRGAFDDIKALGAIAKKHKIWFHVDGAWGGAVGFSPKYKKLLDGLDYADSFVFDAHKMLGLPLMCSFFFNRHLGLFDKHFQAGDTSYIFHQDDETQDRLNLGGYSLLCGRRADILKFWLELLYYGQEGLAKRVEYLQELCQYFADKIINHQNFELQSPQTINNICFRYIDPQIQDLDEFNLSLRTTLYHRNQALVNFAYINGDLTIRLILTSINQTKESCDELFGLFENTAKEILNAKRH